MRNHEITAIFILFLWLGLASIIIVVGSTMPEAFGQLGDAFGMINSFFSALAFIGVIYSFWQQRQILRRQDFEIRNNEINSQRQIGLLNLQLIESTFLNSLNGIETIVSSLNKIDRNSTKGSYFEDMYSRLNAKYFADVDAPNLITLRKFYYDNEWQFGHYFRFITTILKLIDDSQVSEEKKRLYIGLLQSRMSNDELRSFLYYVISELSDNDDQPGTITYRERLKLQGLIRKFTFFDIVRTRLAINLINPGHDWEILRRLTYEPFDTFSMHDM